MGKVYLMRIGLITLHSENNYGAALQATALRMVLNKFGETRVINYQPDNSGSCVFRESKQSRQLKLKAVYSLWDSNNIIAQSLGPIVREKKFQRFIQTYGNLTESYSAKDLAEGLASDFDLYVCGSDQIWNPRITNLDPVYFCSFAPKSARKISYASSSGGGSYSRIEAEKVKEYLSSFSSVSTREEFTAKELKEITGKHVSHVLDPTLLLTASCWKSLFTVTEKPSIPYILVYNMSKATEAFKVTKKIARENHFLVYNIRNWYELGSLSESKDYVDVYLNDAGPLDFLELILNARYVITDSFHGAVFSTIFNKPFISFMPVSGAGRMESLLKMFDLSERLVRDGHDVCKIPLEIDFTKPNLLLEKQRMSSLEFLCRAVTG